MIDHYYDKLLRLCSFTTSNSILNKMKEDKLTPLLSIIQTFKEGKLTDEYMDNYVKEHSL